MVDIKYWADGVPGEEAARVQLENVSKLPIVWPHVAVMPDYHYGIGCTVGSVVPTRKAIIPSTVGVDLGCGMMAYETALKAADLPDNLFEIRSAIEAAVPHGRTNNGGKGDRGAWSTTTGRVDTIWTRTDMGEPLVKGFERLAQKHPKIGNGNTVNHLGTLGSGNHFLEVCLDERDHVWVMLHSGSRGVGNRIGSYFIALAQEDMREHIANLPDKDLAYLNEGTQHFDDYVEAVTWAQQFALSNRQCMMGNMLEAIQKHFSKPIKLWDGEMAVQCHHNYVQRETHFGEELFVTRKGAVSAKLGELGIVPGSMGSKSFIVRGKGNADSFHSCSHGAGRSMSRTAAKKKFTVEDQIKATEGIECRKDVDVIDEIPYAYKPIDLVMKAQEELVEIVHTLRQVLCVKG